MINDRHAYLIMAHNQPELLKKLLILLDDERNDIYIHVDKKMSNFQKDEYEKVLNKSEIRWVKRTDAKWGSYSLINCELLLLEEAIKVEHGYYHLLSGADLPLKSQDEIHKFFKKNHGLEFVAGDGTIIREDLLERVKYYHFYIGKPGKKEERLRRHLREIQDILGINRIKKYPGICFQKGSQWFSITHELAVFVVNKKRWIKKVFWKSSCGDEMFLQTVVRNSMFVEKICNQITMPMITDTRYIDWKRGNPYVFRINDYLDLVSSTALFARKFDDNVDDDIIEKLYLHLKDK